MLLFREAEENAEMILKETSASWWPWGCRWTRRNNAPTPCLMRVSSTKQGELTRFVIYIAWGQFTASFAYVQVYYNVAPLLPWPEPCAACCCAPFLFFRIHQRRFPSSASVSVFCRCTFFRVAAFQCWTWIHSYFSLLLNVVFFLSSCVACWCCLLLRFLGALHRKKSSVCRRSSLSPSTF